VFYSRERLSRPGPGRFLAARSACLWVACLLMLAGMGLELRWLVGAGMAVAAAGLVLRYLDDRSRPAVGEDVAAGDPDREVEETGPDDPGRD
jgi:hypothetical protein